MKERKVPNGTHIATTETHQKKKEKNNNANTRNERPENEMRMKLRERNASQQTTLIMINMPNKWTLKISSVLSRAFVCRFCCCCCCTVDFLLHYYCFFFHPLIAFIGISLHNALCDLFLSCYVRYTTIFSQFIFLLAVWLHREKKNERINFIKRFFPHSFVHLLKERERHHYGRMWLRQHLFILSVFFSLHCCFVAVACVGQPCVSFALDSRAMDTLSGRQFGKSWMPVMISLVTWKINKFSSIGVNTNQFFESKRSNNTKFSHTPKHVFERVRKSFVVVVVVVVAAIPTKKYEEME